MDWILASRYYFFRHDNGSVFRRTMPLLLDSVMFKHLQVKCYACKVYSNSSATCVYLYLCIRLCFYTSIISFSISYLLSINLSYCEIFMSVMGSHISMYYSLLFLTLDIKFNSMLKFFLMLNFL